MNVNPELYDRTNRLQERDGLELLARIREDQRKGLVSDPAKVVIDVGCGTGNITDRIGKFVSIEQLIGLDMSQEMIAYSRSHHTNTASFPISYLVADILSDSLDSLLETESADIVTSIYCMHWIPAENQGKALANIRNLLKPGGMCYLLLFSWSDMLPLQEQLIYHPRWRKYFKSVIGDEEEKNASLNVQKDGDRRRRKSSAPFPTFEPPATEERISFWKQRCSDLLFEGIDVSLHQATFNFGDWKSFQEELKSICHHLPYIPRDEQPLFLEDYYEHVKNTYSGRGSEPTLLSYEYLIVQAKKPAAI